MRRIAVDSTICGVTMNRVLVVLNQYLPWLPSDVRTLRKTPRKSDICTFAPDCNYFYIGIARALHYFFEKAPSDINEIEIDIGIDGLPISKSSKSQLWPILLNIVGFPDIFVIAAYHGKTKAIDFQLFLKDVIEEMTIIEDIGFEYKNRSMVVKLRCLICDSDARAKVLSVKSHSGYFSCTKCTIKGESIGPGHIFFPFTQNTLAVSRTNKSFQKRENPEHHKCMTPIALENIRFGCVSQVPIDYMHCVLLGTMKQLLNLWIKQRKFEYSLSKTKLLKVSNLLTSIKLPIEFNRQPRSLEEYERWKATEFRHFILYTGPVILKNILAPKYYEHFLKFFCGICILSHKTFCREQNFTAKSLLEQFSGNMEKLYGQKSATFNVHSLLHLADDCQLYSCLENFSAFKFENYLSSIKLKIKSGHLPLHQLYNRITEYYSLEAKYVKPSYPTLKKKLNNNNYKSVILSEHQFSVDFPNNYCLIKNKVFKVDAIFKQVDDIYLGVFEIQNLRNFFESPFKSCRLHIYSSNVPEIICPEKKIFNLNCVQSKIVKIELDDSITFFPLIHTFSP